MRFFGVFAAGKYPGARLIFTVEAWRGSFYAPQSLAVHQGKQETGALPEGSNSSHLRR